MAKVADLLIKIGADTKELNKEIASAKRQLNNAFGKEFLSMSGTALKTLEGLTAGIVAIGAASLKTATHLQTTRMAFQNLMQNAEKANRFSSELEDFAFNTPIDFTQVTSLAKEMVSLGLDTQETMAILKSAGDTSFGLGQGAAGVDRIIQAFKEIIGSSEVSAEKIKSLAKEGIPAWEMLAEYMGTDVPTAMQKIADKSVDVETVINAFVTGMNSRFGGQMNEYGKTLEGGLSALQDGVERALRHIGIRLDEALGVGSIMTEAGNALGDFANAVEKSGIIGALNEAIPTKFKLAIIGIATALVTVAIPAIYASVLALAPLITTIGAAVAATGPFIVAGAAIAGTLAALVLYWDEVCNAFNAGMQAIGTIVAIGTDTIAEAFLWLGKCAVNAVGAMFEEICGYCPSWLEDWNNMLDSAIDGVRSFARETISWFKKVFEVKEQAGSADENSDSWDIHSKNFDMYDVPKYGGLFSKFKGAGLNKEQNNGKAAASKQTDEEKAVDAYIKKLVESKNYADELWKKQSASAALYAKQLSVMGDKYKAIDAQHENSLASIKTEHQNYLEGLDKERSLAEQISDGNIRNQALASIRERTEAEQKYYDLKVKEAELERNKSMAAQAVEDYNNNHIDRNADYYETMQLQESNSYRENIEALKAQADNGIISLEQYIEKYNELTVAHEAFQDKLSKAKEISSQMAGSFTNAFMSFLEGTKTAGQAFADFAKSIIMYIIQMIIQAMILKAIAPWINGIFGLSNGGLATMAEGGVVYAATGGRIRGPGTSTSDSIPAMLSDGEYVISAKAVDRLGVPFLDNLNSGMYRTFSTGGVVENLKSRPSVKEYAAAKRETDFQPSSSTSISMNISALDAGSFADFLEHGGLDRIKQALFENNRQFAGEMGVW